MRRINLSKITQNIKEMCIEANHGLTSDMDNALKKEMGISTNIKHNRTIFVDKKVN